MTTASGPRADPPTAHPSAQADIDEAEAAIEAATEEIERKARGEIDPPWPDTSKAFGAIGVASGFAAGIAITIPNDGIRALVFIVFAASAAALLSTARWMHRHFENGPRPAYADQEGGHD